ncbi:MAG: PAS domain-containing sensor histidine kinase [Gemmatimonadaceae bacterium]|nr:PAS domain-containing sensor histidine kinase [Gemmatimonadaceae bacterium]
MPINSPTGVPASGDTGATKSELEELFQQSPAFFALFRGPDLVLERVNEAGLQMVGHRAIIGKPFLEALPEMQGQGFDKIMLDVMATGTPFIARAVPAQVVRTVGSSPEDVFVDLVYMPLRNRDGKAIGVISHGSDVTEQVVARKEAEEKARELALKVEEASILNDKLSASEEQFRTALNALPTLAWMANADGWIFWYNNQWYEYTGTTPADMEGWGWQSVHDAEILPSVLEKWAESISSGAPFEMEFPLRSAEGEFRWFLTRVSPLRDSNGIIQRWVGSNTDVHLQREAAEASRAANQAKADFLAAMSHETRQPINATLGFLDVLELGLYGTLNDQQLKGLGRIRTNQEQLLTVITDILSFARLEAGKVELQRDKIFCSEIVEALPALVEHQVAARSLSLEVENCPADLALIGDRNRILQISTNLITNATRATPPGGRISVRMVPRDNSVDIEFEDTGCGIPADKLEQIFAPFIQLDRSLNQPKEGVGLGLAISRDLAKGMDGEISVRSEVGTGSVFTLTLPRSL